MNQTLLIELRTEELPPKVLNQLGNSFANNIVELLNKEMLIEEKSEYTTYASPRRLAVEIKNVKSVQEDKLIVKKGPSVANGLKDGVPTKALEGFARSCQLSIEQLSIIDDGKQEHYVCEYIQKGQSLSALINDVLASAVKKLPIPKVMHWGSSDFTFVRPVHGLIVLYGDKLLTAQVLGLNSQNWTLGHRFLSEGKIVIQNADLYAKTLFEKGKVIANFNERKSKITEDLNEQSTLLHGHIVADEGLLDEVTALVEFPVVLSAQFEAHFLAVPQECLILTMQKNQKYFPLIDSNGKLINQFLLVSNLETKNPKFIIEGNERVLRARLSDAEFFYNQDKKNLLISQLDKLKNIIYHNKIGSQLERVERLEKISVAIAERIGADNSLAQRAAQLAKADLVTEMVGEFPELQGTMGKYYAQNDGENVEVCHAIEQHYQPRYAGDKLPDGKISTAIALADKLETIVGIWGIGLKPTGEKDPYALRRASLGVIRMLMNYDINIKDILKIVFASFPSNILNKNTIEEVFEFLKARLHVYLSSQYSNDVVAAVLSKNLENLVSLKARLQAVENFKAIPDAIELAAANKRVNNLLKKSDIKLGLVDQTLFELNEEKELYKAYLKIQPEIKVSLINNDFQTALSKLSTIKKQIDNFFDKVMVMDERSEIKQNRLNLLNQLAQLMNAVADIALLTE